MAGFLVICSWVAESDDQFHSGGMYGLGEVMRSESALGLGHLLLFFGRLGREWFGKRDIF